MVEIKCLVCGETLEIPQFIDTDNYDGQVVCQECGSLLEIKLIGSKVRKYRLVKKNIRQVPIKQVTVVKDYGKEGK